MNQIHFIGYLGKDPDMRYTPEGRAVTDLRVGCTDPFSNATLWINVSVWGKQAEACNQHLSKGRQVYIRGRLLFDQTTGSPRTFKRNDGTVGTSFDVNAENVTFLGKAPAREENYDVEDDEIPF